MHVDSFGAGLETDRIHENKLSHEIIDFLVRKRGAQRRDMWIECDTRMCDVYMAYLASHIRDYWGASPLTNIDDLDALLDIVERSRTPNAPKRPLATVVSEIEAKMPTLPPDYPVDDIIALRHKYERPYERFRRAFIKLRSKLNKTEDEESADEIVQGFRWDLEDSLSEMAEGAREQKFDLLHASLRTTFSVAGAAATMLVAQDSSKKVGPFAAVVMLTYKFGEELRRMRLDREKALRDNDFSYLYLINRDLE